jgi:hypothetical protein
MTRGSILADGARVGSLSRLIEASLATGAAEPSGFAWGCCESEQPTKTPTPSAKVTMPKARAEARGRREDEEPFCEEAMIYS